MRVLDVETCPGWEGGSWDALGEARCNHCGYSWYTHGAYSRPRPADRPPDFDVDSPEWAAMWADEEDADEAAARRSGGEQGAGTGDQG
jgi:hypothetical protein